MVKDIYYFNLPVIFFHLEKMFIIEANFERSVSYTWHIEKQGDL
jgi:hypothetical protein